ncbi:MAG TPA: alpha/beta fold hydrolase, partial [Desulfobacterales bacterium]|nr:alpha/beta fold hydrolase [Desulfobacterales bacterium]
EGAGEPLLMLHGNPTWSFYNRSLVKGLSGGYRVVVPDHIGCGLSDKPGERRYDYRLSSRVADLEALLGRVGLKGPLTLVLHDWGGMIGMAYAVAHPERIRRLVLLNTAAFLPPDGKRLPLRLRLIRDMRQLAGPLVLRFNLFARAALRMASRRGLAADVRAGLIAPYNSPANRIATLKFVQDIPLEPRDPSYALVASVSARLPLLAAVPMLLLWGRHDFVFDGDYLAEWRRRFPAARVEIFERAGHYLLEDEPERVLERIRAFLAVA